MMNQTTTVDPVCGMTIDTPTEPNTSHFHGVAYHFCSIECKKKFELAPEQWLAALS